MTSTCNPCEPLYWCPTAGQMESPCHGGFDTCCDRPDLHQDVCACGCGEVILPTDNHPWFKGAQCQALWEEMGRLPGAEQVRFSWDQRFYHELWVHTPWRSAYWCGPLSEHSVVSAANGVLSSYNYVQLDPDHPEALADAMRIMIYYINDEIRVPWDGRDGGPPVPRWARERVRRPTWNEMVREHLAKAPQEVQEASVGPI